MDAGQQLGDVAHVSTAQRQRSLERLVDGRTTEPRHLGAHGFGQPGIGFERVVHWLGLLDAVVAAGGDRTGQEAVAHLGFQIGQ